jgi:hypothetical protein
MKSAKGFRVLSIPTKKIPMTMIPAPKLPKLPKLPQSVHNIPNVRNLTGKMVTTGKIPKIKGY